MKSVIFLCLALVALSGCRTIFCTPPTPYFGFVDPPRAVAFRVLAERDVTAHDESVSIFTRRDQYAGANVDFDHEQVVRVTARSGAGSHVTSVQENDNLYAITVKAVGCSPGDARQFDIVVPLDAHMPEVFVDRGACKPDNHCSPHDLAMFAEHSGPEGKIPEHSRAVRYRVLSEAPADRALAVNVFTHAAQYRGTATVDFDHEEVVRVSGPGIGAAALLWVAETDAELLVGVVYAQAQCAAYPTPDPPKGTIDIAIPVTVKPVRVVGHDSGPACIHHGEP